MTDSLLARLTQPSGPTRPKWYGWLLCLIGAHQWTCQHAEGIPPDAERVRRETARYWLEYSAVYCRRCGRTNA